MLLDPFWEILSPLGGTNQAVLLNRVSTDAADRSESSTSSASQLANTIVRIGLQPNQTVRDLA
jgi:hypothetical protein